MSGRRASWGSVAMVSKGVYRAEWRNENVPPFNTRKALDYYLGKLRRSGVDENTGLHRNQR